MKTVVCIDGGGKERERKGGGERLDEGEALCNFEEKGHINMAVSFPLCIPRVKYQIMRFSCGRKVEFLFR